MNTSGFSFLTFFLSIIAVFDISADNHIDSLKYRLSSAQGKEKIEILDELTTSLWNNAPDKSLNYGNEALELSRKSNDYTNECKSLRNIGISYTFLSQYKHALKFFEESLVLAKEKNLTSEVALSYNSLGNYNYLTGSLEKALDYYQKAYAIGMEINNKSSLISYVNNIGIIYSNLGNYEKALEFYLKSLNISEEIKDKQGMLNSYVNIGTVYNDIKNYSKSLQYYNKALKISYEINNLYVRATILNNIGNIYSAEEKLNEALNYYKQSLEIKERIGDEFGKAVSLGDIGYVYSHLGNNELALKYQKQSLLIQQKTGNTEGQIISLLSIGQTYSLIGRYDDAISNYNAAEKLSKGFNAKLLLDVYSAKADTYEKMGNYSGAYKFFRMYSELKDSFFNENNSRQIAELETKYETEKKDKEISLLLRDKKINELYNNNQAFIRNTLIIGILALIFIALLIYNRSRLKTRANILLEEKVNKINEQKEDLRSLNANKDKLLSIISHDLRSPFQALVGYSELLANNISDLSKEEVVEYSADINATSHQTLELLENLLEWSRLQLGKIQHNPVSFYIEPFINKTLRLMLHTAMRKEIFLKADIPMNFYVYADEQMIASALHNLLSNAIKFSHRCSTVKVYVSANDKHAEIIVEDSGTGISKENINKLFNRDIHFSTKGTNEEKGSGLGLELTKELIEKNGGTICVESEEGKGSRFIFTVPRSKD